MQALSAFADSHDLELNSPDWGEEPKNKPPRALSDKLQARLVASLLRATPPFLKHCEFRPIQSKEEFQMASHLVYLQYLRKQYAIPNRGRLRLTIHQLIRKSTTFIGMYKKKYVLGTLTMVEDSPLGLPMDKLYQQELDILRKSGAKMAECTMLALNNTLLNHPSIPNSVRLIVLLNLFRSGFSFLLDDVQINNVVACFHPRHEGFYKALQFQNMGDLKEYSSVRDNPAVAYYLDLDYARQHASPRLKAFFGVDQEKKDKKSPQKRYVFNLKEFGQMFLNSSR